MWGAYCCKTAMEENANANLDECDGSSISLHSVCCQNREYEKCPGAKGCLNNMGIPTERC